MSPILIESKPQGEEIISGIICRYTIIDWAPKSLVIQFKRAANIYFLIISVLTTMSFSPKVETTT